MVLHVNRHGTKLSVSTPETGLVEFDRLLAVCTLYELQSGHDVALPYDAPRLLNTIAQGYERKVLRYLISPADNSDARARTVSASQLWVRDGLFMAVKLLAIMKERGLSLSQLLSELPEFFCCTAGGRGGYPALSPGGFLFLPGRRGDECGGRHHPEPGEWEPADYAFPQREKASFGSGGGQYGSRAGTV